ncbi:MAG: isopenicillin N synthase family dioxygenase [Thermaurantiacus sp.]
MATRIADTPPIPLSLVAADPAAAAHRFGDSFRRTGFAVVEGHGVAETDIAEMVAAMKAVFALGDAEKRRSHVPGGAGQRGYTPFGVETAKDSEVYDLKEFWHVGRELPPAHPHAAIMAPNVWPEAVPAFRLAALRLFASLEQAGLVVLSAIARHLDLPPDFFVDPVKDGNSILRLLHYPPVPDGAPGVRAGAHEDINVITLLLGAEEAGLELFSREGEWLRVEAPAGSLVVNVGDMLQRLTGGDLPSTTHRVVNPAPERRHISRYSMPFFLHFRPDYLIAPIAGDRSLQPITAHDFLTERLREIRLL